MFRKHGYDISNYISISFEVIKSRKEIIQFSLANMFSNSNTSSTWGDGSGNLREIHNVENVTREGNGISHSYKGIIICLI